MGVGSPSPDTAGSKKSSAHRYDSGIALKKEARGSPVANMMWHKVGIAHDMAGGSPRGMGSSKSTPSLNSPTRMKSNSRDLYDAPALSKSASSSDHAIYQMVRLTIQF
jgi:hypothetical protein